MRSASARKPCSETTKLAESGVRLEPSGRKTCHHICWNLSVGTWRAGRRAHRPGAGTAPSPLSGRGGARHHATPRHTTPPTMLNGGRSLVVASRQIRKFVELRCKPATDEQHRLVFHQHILPAIGDPSIASLGRRHAADLQHRSSNRPAKARPGGRHAVAADRTGHRLRARAACEAAPARVCASTWGRRRKRFLTVSEFRRLGRALDELERSNGISMHPAAAIRSLARTGCRCNEILTAALVRTCGWRQASSACAIPRTGPRIVPLSPAAA